MVVMNNSSRAMPLLRTAGRRPPRSVGSGGVDQPVPDLERSGDGPLGLSGGIWYTPKPTIGISTPLFNVTPGTFMVADGVDWFVPRVGLF